MPEELRLHRLAWPVRNLGAGARLGVWTQGCSSNCPGCCSADSHDLAGGALASVDKWLGLIEQMLGGATPDGLTVSGGEPTLQAPAVARLIEACRGRYPGLDVLLYSGESWQRLAREFPGLIRACDLVVSEPYREEIPPRCALHGSGNQTIHLLTPLAKRRYLDGRTGRGGSPLTITSVTDARIGGLGIPSRLDHLATALSRRGIVLEQPSWRR